MFKRIACSVISFLLVFTLLFPANASAAMAAGTGEEHSVRRIYDETDAYGSYIQPYYVDEYGNRIEDKTENKAVVRAAVALPSSYDARTDNVITSVKDQGASSNCWAFAASSAMETSMIKQGYASLSDLDYSEAHLVWFTHRQSVSDTSDGTYGDGKYVSNPFAKGGHWNDVASTYARSSGPVEESTAPWHQVSESRMLSEMAQDESARYDHDARLWSLEETQDRSTAKRWIMENGSVATCFYHNSSYYNIITGGYYQNVETSTNHEVAIVGWDDSFSAENFNSVCKPSSDGAWLVKNSWGSGWGKSGYFWLSYEDASCLWFAKYVAAPVDIYDNIYQYDGAKITSYRYYTGTTTAYEANRFRTKRSELLTHVGIYNSLAGSSATVEIYVAPETYQPYFYSNPVSGMRLVSTATTTAFDVGYGYLTIPLDNPVELPFNRYFTVKVTYDSPSNEPARLPIEGENSEPAGEDGTTYYGSHSGESYIGRNGSWKDTGDSGLNNVPIKVMTRTLPSDTHCIFFDVNHDAIRPNLFAASRASVTKDGMYYRYSAAADTVYLDGTTLVSGGELSNMPFSAEAGTYTVCVTGSGTVDATSDRAYFVLELQGSQELENRYYLEFTGSGTTSWTVTAGDAAIINCVRLWQRVDSNSRLRADNAAFQIKIEKATSGTAFSPPAKCVTQGSAYGTLPTLERDGYTFDGWYTSAVGGTQITAESSFTGTADQTLYAHWSANTFSVFFNVRHGAIKPNLFPASRTDVTVKGLSYHYSAEDDAIVLNGTAAGSGTVSDMPFQAEEGTYTVQVTQSGTIDAAGDRACFVLELLSPQALDSGYSLEFTGSETISWTITAEDAAKITGVRLSQQVGAESSLIADHAAFRIKIEKASSASAFSPHAKCVAFDSVYGTLPVPERAGFTFGGWCTSATGGTQITADSKVTLTASQTLYARWTINTYNVFFDVNHDAIRPNLYAASRTNASKDGMSYRYSAADDTVVLNGTAACSGEISGVPFKAETGTYTVQITGSGTVDATPDHACFVLELQGSQALGDRYFVDFTGSKTANWTVTAADAAKIDSVRLLQSVDEDGSLTANNAAFRIKIEKAQSASAFSPPAKNVTYNVAYGTLPAPERAGCTFCGWYTLPDGGTQITASARAEITSDATLYAHWEVKTCTVQFDANGGACPETGRTVTYGETYGELPVPTREGYTFDGWYSADGTLVAESTVCTTTDDHTLTARWTAVGYTVTLDPDGGVCSIPAITAYYGAQYGELPVPTCEGFTFDGWFSADGTPVTESTVCTTADNHMLTARWAAVWYTVTLDPDGGVCGIPAITAYYGEHYGVLPVPTREGYTFDGWYSADGTLVAESTTVTTANDQTLTARWTAVAYTVTLDPNGGECGIPAITAYYDEVYGVLPIPTRAGFVFDGWFSADGTPVTESTVCTTTDDHTLTARWTEVLPPVAPKPESDTVVDRARGFVYGLKFGVTEEALLNYYLDISDGFGMEIETGTGMIGTGTVVRLIDNKTGDTVETFTVVIFGDLNGDGMLNAADVSAVRSANARLTVFAEDSAQFFAADIVRDGMINAADVAKFRSANARLTDIGQTV